MVAEAGRGSDSWRATKRLGSTDNAVTAKRMWLLVLPAVVPELLLLIVFHRR